MDGPGVQYSALIRCSGRKIETKSDNTAGGKCFSDIKAYIKNHDICHTWGTFSKSVPRTGEGTVLFRHGTRFSVFANCEHQQVLKYKTGGTFAL